MLVIGSGATVGVSGVTIADGKGASNNVGGIANSGTLTLRRVAVVGNAGGVAGGIYTFFLAGSLTVVDSTISGNVASFGAEGGGGIWNDGASVVIRNSTITGNTISGSVGFGAGGIGGGNGAWTSIDSSTIIYDSVDDFVRNSASSATLTPGNPGRETLGQNFGIYFQDDWKPLANVTLNLGLRYEYFAVLRESQDRTEPFNMETGDLAPPGSPYYRPDRNNIGPRAGVTWSPFPSDRTIVRGGFGIYYQAYPTGFGAYSLPFNNIAGSTTMVRAQIPALSLPLEPFLASGTTPLPTVAGFDPDRRDIYTEQWTANIQQELGSNTVFQLAYVGNRGHNLRRNLNINFFDPALGTRPNPKFADINIEGNTGKSLYHALQASFKRRFSNGAAFDIEYTYGHALDDVQDQGLSLTQPQDNDNLAAEWGNSSGDIRHNLAFNFIYELPFGPDRRFGSDTAGVVGQLIAGWEIVGLGISHTGIPFTVELGGNSFGNFNFVNQRPDRVPGVSSVPDNRTITNWLHPAAFAEPRPGTFSNLGRNTEYGPGFAQVDLSLLKTARLRGSHILQFRAEFFNIFNHASFNAINTTFGDGAFGRVTGARDPRIIQFGLKLGF